MLDLFSLRKLWPEYLHRHDGKVLRLPQDMEVSLSSELQIHTYRANLQFCCQNFQPLKTLTMDLYDMYAQSNYFGQKATVRSNES